MARVSKMQSVELDCTDNSSSTAASAFSDPLFARHYNNAYLPLKMARFVHSGVVCVSSSQREFSVAGERVLHWEMAGGLLSLKEFWLGRVLKDSAICIRLGDEMTAFPVAVHAEEADASADDAVCINVCLLMPDGRMHILRLETVRSDFSILAILVKSIQGRLVDVSTLTDIGGDFYRFHQIQNIPETSSVTCGTWQSRSSLTLGLTHGSILCVRQCASGWEEFFLRKAPSNNGGLAVSLSQWWTSSSSAGSNSSNDSASDSHLTERPDVVALASSSTGVFVVDGNGILTFWDSARSKAPLVQTNLTDSWDRDHKNENVDHLKAKICLLENASLNQIFVAVAIELGGQDGQISWEIALFKFSSHGACESLGVIASNSKGAKEMLVGMLIDVQFSAEARTDERKCLNTLWRAEVTANHKEKETNVVTNFCAIVVDANSKVIDIEASKVVSLSAKKRMELWWDDVETRNQSQNDISSSVMLQRIFLPCRFPIRIILGVLTHDVPFELQLLPDAAPNCEELAEVAAHVFEVCGRWAEQLQCPAPKTEAFFKFIELCQRRLVAEEDCGCNRLLPMRREMAEQTLTRCIVANRDKLSLVTTPTGLYDIYHLLVVDRDDEGEKVMSFVEKLLETDDTTNLLSSIHDSILRTIQDFLTIPTDTIVDNIRQALLSLSVTLSLSHVGTAGFAVNLDNLDSLYPDPYYLESSSLNDAEQTFPEESHFLVSDISRMAVAKLYSYHEKASVALAIVVVNRNNAQLNCDAADRKLRLAITNMIYAVYLSWLDDVRPTEASELNRSMDLADILPNSAFSYQGNPANSHNEASVLSNFWSSGERSLPCMVNPDESHKIKSSEWIKDCASRCIHVMRPSPVGDLALYLLHHEQYSCLSRLASILSALVPGTSSGTFTFDKVLRSRADSLQLIGEFCEILRNNSQRRGTSEMLQEEKTTLLELVDAILICAPSPPSVAGHLSTLMSQKETTDDMEEDDIDVEERNSHNLEEFFDGLDEKNVVDAETLSCTRDVLRKLLACGNSPFHTLMTLRRGNFDMDLLLHPILQRLCRLNYLVDSLDLFRRARCVLPVDVGAHICAKAGELLIPTLQTLLLTCADSEEMLGSLEIEFMTSLNRIFNAALENLSFDAAWRPIEIMLELDKDSFFGGFHEMLPLGGVVPQWQVCLRSLVSLACDSGHLEWLCSQSITNPFLADEIVVELDRLTRSSACNTNYFECLFSFLLRRHDFLNAAQSLFVFSTRPDNGLSALRCRTIAAAICTLSNRHVPTTQRYLVSQMLPSSGSVDFSSQQRLSLQFLIDLANAELTLIEPSYHDRRIANASSSSVLEECEQCVDDLCQIAMNNRLDLIFLALSIAILGEDFVRSSRNMDTEELNFFSVASGVSKALERAVRGLTDFCACGAIDESVWESQAGVTSFYTHADGAVNNELSAVLLDVLATLDRGHWALHLIAIERILELHDLDRNELLLEALCQSTGNRSALVKLLMSANHLFKACLFAQDILRGVDFSKKTLYLPLTLFDELICLCETQKDNAHISEALSDLRAALVRHFQQTIVS